MNSANNKPLVIIGSGLAGYHVAKEFRKLDSQTPLIIVTQDDGHFYSKPQLSTAIKTGKTAKELIVTDVSVMQTQLNATIYTHATVSAIDASQQCIQIETPEQTHTIIYRDLVLALGASPRPFALLDKVQNHYRINNRMEYSDFTDNLDTIEHLGIIGSGLVGCEFAHDIIGKVKKLSVITIDPQPLHNLVPARIGQALQRSLEKLGIDFYTQAQIQTITENTNTISLQLADHSLDLDCLLVAIGLLPNITLAKMANINVNQGIIVDSFLQTNQPHIYALGDCAQINGVCKQYVAPILQSARALAQTLAGNPCQVTFPATPISLKVNTYPVIVHLPSTQDGQWHYEEKEDGIKALFIDSEDQVQGYALSGSGIEYRQECLKAMTQANKTTA